MQVEDKLQNFIENAESWIELQQLLHSHPSSIGPAHAAAMIIRISQVHPSSHPSHTFDAAMASTPLWGTLPLYCTACTPSLWLVLQHVRLLLWLLIALNPPGHRSRPAGTSQLAGREAA